MNAHVKLSPEENLEIARAIFSGASHQEISEDYGVSIRYVMIQVEKLRKTIARSASRSASAPASQNIIPMRPIERKLTVWPLHSPLGRELGIVAVREGAGPSMPYVSILHGERA